MHTNIHKKQRPKQSFFTQCKVLIKKHWRISYFSGVSLILLSMTPIYSDHFFASITGETNASIGIDLYNACYIGEGRILTNGETFNFFNAMTVNAGIKCTDTSNITTVTCTNGLLDNDISLLSSTCTHKCANPVAGEEDLLPSDIITGKYIIDSSNPNTSYQCSDYETSFVCDGKSGYIIGPNIAYDTCTDVPKNCLSLNILSNGQYDIIVDGDTVNFYNNQDQIDDGGVNTKKSITCNNGVLKFESLTDMSILQAINGDTYFDNATTGQEFLETLENVNAKDKSKYLQALKIGLLNTEYIHQGSGSSSCRVTLEDEVITIKHGESDHWHISNRITGMNGDIFNSCDDPSNIVSYSCDNGNLIVNGGITIDRSFTAGDANTYYQECIDCSDKALGCYSNP